MNQQQPPIPAPPAPQSSASQNFAPQPSAPPQDGAPGQPASQFRLRFGGVIRSEWIKLMSLRSIKVTLIVTFALILGLSLLVAFASRSSFEGGGAEAMRAYLTTTATFPVVFLALIFGVLGVFAIASEYSSGMILSTLTAVPRRTPVFMAKAILLAVISIVSAVLLLFGGLAIASAVMPDAAGEVFSEQIVSSVFGAVSYLLLLALLAFGLATILRSTAGGISSIVAIVFVLPIGFQLLSITEWEWVPTALNYLPSSLGTTLGNGLVGGEMQEFMVDSAAPGYWQAMLAMAIWAAVFVIPAAFLFKARDAK